MEPEQRIFVRAQSPVLAEGVEDAELACSLVSNSFAFMAITLGSSAVSALLLSALVCARVRGRWQLTSLIGVEIVLVCSSVDCAARLRAMRARERVCLAGPTSSFSSREELSSLASSSSASLSARGSGRKC